MLKLLNGNMNQVVEMAFGLFDLSNMDNAKPKRRKWSWTPYQEERCATVLLITDSLKDYWPLTLRQVYYQLVSQGYIENTRSAYTQLSTLLKWMRIDDRLPWDCIEDRTRTVTDKRGYENPMEFIEENLNYLFQGYARCRVQSQERYVEVWIEKDGLLRIVKDVVRPYCLRAVVCRGYQSVSFIADYYNRAEQAKMRGQTPVILYFGDLDPSGVQMFEATQETLENELGLTGVQYRRCALLPEHIAKHNLPLNPDAIKKADTRYRTYQVKYGDVAVELDALHPQILEQLIETAIRQELNMENFNNEVTQEKHEQAQMRAFRQDAVREIRQLQKVYNLV